MQIARALIQTPDRVLDIEASLVEVTSRDSDFKEGGNSRRDTISHVSDVDSSCTHCNECIIITIDVTREMDCPIKETAISDQNEI